MGNTKVNFRSAEGIARYPRLTNADELDDKFKTQLIMSAEAAKPLMAMCLEAGEEAFGPKGVDKLKMPWKIDEDTGDVVFVVKTKYQPKFVDGATTPIHFDNVPKIYSGSKLKVVGTIGDYELSKVNKGINLNLNKVQILSLSDGNFDDDGEGFDAVEGGYVAPKVSKDADDLDGDRLPTNEDDFDY